MSKTATITSRWEIPYSKLKDNHIHYILKSRYTGHIIDKAISEFISDGRSYKELKCIATEAYWKAMKSYNPKKGKFTNHAFYICRSYLYRYVSRAKKPTILLNEDILIKNTTEKDLNRKITLDKILSKVNKKDRTFLEKFYFMNSSIKEAVKYFGINRYKLKKRLDKALIQARMAAE